MQADGSALEVVRGSDRHHSVGEPVNAYSSGVRSGASRGPFATAPRRLVLVCSMPVVLAG
ncbi:MAG: hypothetical protein MUC96_22910 [Myxococcaceae bacterium]|nr:hypothetical protein [Myxococcaceae bacterium]